MKLIHSCDLIGSHPIKFKYDVTCISEGSKSSTHYLSDKNRFDVSSKGPSSGISVERRKAFARNVESVFNRLGSE